MDPNAALRALRYLAHEVERKLETSQCDVDPSLRLDVSNLVEHFDALDKWLTGGGSLPWGWGVRK